MSPVLVDSNVIIDVATWDPVWGEWSAKAIGRLANTAPLVINPIVYAEVSVDFARIEEVERWLPADIYRREPLPYEAAFMAGKCHREYRRRGGAKHSVLADFLVGAHAAVRGYQLLTRDARRLSTYFPRLELIAPG